MPSTTESSPNYSLSFTPSFYAENSAGSRWVNPHADASLSAQIPQFYNTGISVNAQAWNLGQPDINQNLLLNEFRVSSPEWQPNEQTSWQLSGGIFDRENNILSTSGPTLMTQETVLTYAGDIPGQRAMKGGQIISKNNIGSFGLNLKGGVYTNYESASITPTATARATLSYADIQLKYGDASSGSVAVGTGAVSYKDYRFDTNENKNVLTSETIPELHFSVTQNLALSTPFSLSASVLYARQGAGEVKNPNIEATNYETRSWIPQAGFYGTAGSVDYGAYAGAKFTPENTYRELGAWATLHPHKNVDVIGVGTLYETDSGMVPSGEFKIKVHSE